MDMPQDQYDLYAEFGMTAEMAQVLEVAAGNVAIGFLAMFVTEGKVTPDETEVYRAVVNDVNRKTFGALLKHIKKTMNLSDSMIAIVDEALDRRNYVTHHFFRTHNFRLYSEEGRKVMLAELKEIQAKLGLAQKMLEAMVALMEQIAGRKPLDLDWLQKLQARGRKVDI